jgi:multiple sugar transport system substrate-binding protein
MDVSAYVPAPIAGAAEMFRIEDGVWGMPYTTLPSGFWVNMNLWEEAGLTDADFPTTWEELQTVAEKLTDGDVVGLAFGPEWQRIGTFMAQAGGGLLDASGAAAVDTPENASALEFVQKGLTEGWMAFPSAIDAGWGGEALGIERAAMVIEGNWIAGFLNADFPDVNWTAVELPAGAAGQGTLQFTQGWGIAADSTKQDAAVDLVRFLMSDEQQMVAARGFGVMPSVSTVAEEWTAEFPNLGAFVAGGNYSQGVPALQGIGAVLGDFNGQIEGLATGDIQSILSSVQASLAEIAG